MRHNRLTLSVAFLLGAALPGVGSGQPAERCESTTCFDQMQIRRFEVIDQTSLIVYVGRQECPFLVELSGMFCDLTFLPGYDLVFRPNNLREAREPSTPGRANRVDVRYRRVCANDLGMGITEGPFTSTISRNPGSPADDHLEPDGIDCNIRDIRSLTDDEVLEVYVDNRLTPPPPPFGAGQVSVEGEGEDREDSTR